MIKSVALTFFVSMQVAFAQNLVPNPSFEQYIKCPVSFSTDPLYFGPNQWNSPSKGTPDYFNKCSFSEMHVPDNWAGISHAHSGAGYAGIYAWNEKKKDYREYIQCKLTEPMKAGVSYDIKFFYRLSLFSVYAIDRIAVALSTTEVKADHDIVLKLKPIFTEIKSLDRITNAWMSLSTNMVATGGEQYLIIGNFSSNDSTESMKIETRDGKSLMLGTSAYYYIDDVSVFSNEPPPPETEEIQAPKLNETYILKNIHFEHDSYELLSSSYTELDILISVLKKNPKWKVQLSGHTDDVGSDEYNLALSENRVKSVGDYLIKNGVSKERIHTQGFGKQKPIKTGNDEATRALNRRVEAKFLD
ncbi:MAG: OmpA family protein [Bacteroidetes bacterium]|nr:OmpA family protein [Bacteroidota bacterium]